MGGPPEVHCGRLTGACCTVISLKATNQIRSVMATSKQDASKAAKQLKAKGSTAAQKSVAGSDLAQAKKTAAPSGSAAASPKRAPGKKK